MLLCVCCGRGVCVRAPVVPPKKNMVMVCVGGGCIRGFGGKF